MKRILKILGALLLLFVVLQILRTYYPNGHIPNYSYLGLDGKYHSKKELPSTPIIFVYFSPDCGFCEKAIPELQSLRKRYANINYVFVTNQKINKIVVDFINKNNLSELTSFILIDKNDKFPVDFGLGIVYSTPTFLVYDKTGFLLKKFTNYGDIKSLKI